MTFGGWIKRHKKLLLGVLMIVVFVLIGKFISTIDFRALKIYLEKTPGILVGVIIASFTSYCVSTWAWKLCLNEESKKIGFWMLFIYRHVGEMLSVFNPTGIIAGESLKGVILSKRGIPTKYGISSILLQRLFVVVSGFVFVILAIFYLLFKGTTHSRKSIICMILIIAGVLWLFYYMIKILVHPHLYIGRECRRLQRKFHWGFLTDSFVRNSFEMNIEAARFFVKHPGHFWAAFILMMIQWLCGAAEFFIILSSMGLQITMLDAIAIDIGVMFFKTIGSFIPGQIGIEEYGNKVMLDAVDVRSNEIWLVTSLMRRARQLFWLIVAGILSLFISRSLKVKK